MSADVYQTECVVIGAGVVGLAVAIPSVMAYNAYVSRLGLFAGELEGFGRELIATMAREGRL